MLLYNQNCATIRADIAVLISGYASATFVITENCCKTYTTEIADLTATVSTDPIYVDSDTQFIINPEAFAGADTIGDAVYSVTMTLKPGNGDSYIDMGCMFYDCETACLVNTKLADLTKSEQTTLLMEHYALANGTNCDCKCDELCDIYKSLYLTLNEAEYDCGCV